MSLIKTLLAGLVAGTALLAGEPIMKVGIMTDTHLKRTRESCDRLEAALRLFKEQKTDIIINLGDIADHHYPEAYRNYRALFNEIFPDHKPREIYIYANHDTIDQPDWDTAFANLKRLLEIPHDPFDKLVFKDYTFLIIPQRIDREPFENAIKEAIAASNGKPVFVIDHIPPYDTTDNSLVWGNRMRHEVLDNYPQVIHISGHTHNSLRNERCIWQDNFTCVNAGCLQTWGGSLVGRQPGRKQVNEVLIMEVFTDKIDFHRYGLLDKQEILPDKLWSVPWPFDKATAPYSFARRKALSPVPFFPQDAKAEFSCNSPFTELTMTFPYAEKQDNIFTYKIEIATTDQNNQRRLVSRQDLFGDFYLPPDQRPGHQTFTLNAGYLESGVKYQFTITPMDFFGNAGKPLTADFTAPEVAHGQVVFETFKPMEELPFLTGLTEGSPLKQENGFYLHNVYNARLELPKEAWQGPARTHFRFTVDLQMIQPGKGQWTIVLRNPEPLVNANERIYTPPGDSGHQRFVIDFRKREENFIYDLLIREGDAGRVKFEHVKIEKW